MSQQSFLYLGSLEKCVLLKTYLQPKWFAGVINFLKPSKSRRKIKEIGCMVTVRPIGF